MLSLNWENLSEFHLTVVVRSLITFISTDTLNLQQ